MKAPEFLQNFMPGDVVIAVRADPENASRLIVAFISGYQLTCGEGWKWEIPDTIQTEG